MRTVVVGVGNMGGALVRGLVGRGVVTPAELTLIDTDPDKAASLGRELGCAHGTEVELVRGASFVILAVKPQGMGEVLAKLGPFLAAGAVVMSVAAGVTLAQLRAGLHGSTGTVDLVRAMPNTPALVLRGASAFALEPGAPASVRELARLALSAVGVAVEVEERHMDAVTAVSGSGPAYVFAFLEALTAAGEAAGLPLEVAALLARHTVIGAGHLLDARTESAAELRCAVTSPGGTTAAALGVFGQEGALESLVTAAVERARARGAELAAAMSASSAACAGTEAKP